MDLAGKVIADHYKLNKKVDEGVTSTIYLSENIRDKKKYALKILKQEFKSQRSEDIIRFRKEASFVSRLDHPSIVKIFEVGEYEGLHYIVMERILGKSLERLLKESFFFRENDTIELVCQICNALAYVHGYGIIHRDLKPANIMMQKKVRRNPLFKILDFGLVELMEFSEITKEEEIVGTFSYMSPEQSGIVRKPVDGRSDLYSLGVIFYQLLTGELPFKGKDISTILHQQVAKEPESPCKFNKEIPLILEQIVLKLLKKEPEQRYQTADGLQKDLVKYQRGERDFVLGLEDRISRLPYRTRLIGREKELFRLKKLVDEAHKSKGSICLVSGNAGSGKTRLSEELRSYAYEKGGNFLNGKCFNQENKIPYQPFSEVLNDYLARLDKLRNKDRKEEIIARMRNAVGDLGEIICRINPLMRKYLGEVKALVPLDAERENKRFLMVASRFFCNLGTEREAAVLLLDDLQWSDQGSLSLLAEIAQEIEKSPLLIIVTYRDNEIAKNHDLVKLKKEYSLVNLHLASFDAYDMKNLIIELLMEETKNIENLSRYILEKSKGNPFFAIEIARQLVDEKIVVWKQARWQVNWEKLEIIKIPPTIIDIVMRRIELLSEKEKNLLSYAAVIGREFEIELLYTLCELPKEEVIYIVDKAVGLQLLEQNRQKKGSILFVHDRIKDAFYKKIGERKRRVLHLKVARIMEELKKQDPGISVFELAYHYTEGGDEEKTLEYTIPASKLAKEHYANEEALKYFNLAGRLLEKKGKKGDDIWLEIKQGLGDVYLTVGRNDDALKIFNEIIAFGKTKVQKAKIFRQISTAHFKKGDWHNCEKYGKAGLKLLGEKLPTTKLHVFLSLANQFIVHIFHNFLPQLFIRKRAGKIDERYHFIIWFYMILNWMYVLSDVPKFIRSILRMFNISESKIGRSRELGTSVSAFATLCMALPLFKLAIKYHEKGLQLRTEYGDEWGIAQSMQFMGYCYEWKGDYKKSIEYYQKSIEKFRGMGDIWEMGMATLGLSYNYFYLSDYEKTITLLLQYLNISNKLKDDFGICSSKNWLLYCYTKKGDFHKAEEYARASLALSYEKKIWFAYFTANSRLGDLKLEDNNYIEAKECLEKARKLNEENSFLKNYNVFVYPYLACAYILEYTSNSHKLKEKERRRALQGIKKIAQIALHKTKSWVNYYGEALRANAKYYSLIGKKKKARKYFSESIQHHQKLGQRYELGKDYYDYGIFLSDIGDKLYAQDYWQRAYNIFKDIEAKVYINRTKRLLGIEEKETKQDLLLSKQRLASVISLSQYISSILDLEKLLNKIIDTVIQVTGAQRGYLLIKNDAAGSLEVKAARNIEKNTILKDDFQFSRGIITQVFESGEMRITSDAEHDDKYFGFKSIAAYGLKSILCVPIKYQNKVTGVCYLDNPLSSNVFNKEDAEILSVFVSQAAICIENAKSYQTVKELNQELEEKVAKRTTDLKIANEKLKKAYLKLKESDLEKTDFFVNLSHEIKTPLTLISNYLEDYIEKSGVSFDLKIIKQNFNKLLKDMINFFDILRFEKGIRIYNHNQVIDFTEFVDKKVDLFQKLADRQNITITSDIKQKVYIKADILALERILNNLLDNALRYNKPGGKIDVSLKSKRGIIEMLVSDNGIGIEQRKIEKIFLPYYQISHEKQSIQGIGMGLAIVKNIVDSLHGRIIVKSRVNQGSSFKISLPQYVMKAGDLPARDFNYNEQINTLPLTAGSDYKEEIDQSKPNILLVEDNQDLLFFLKNKLGALYNMYCAVNGKEAIGKLKNIPRPDVIISDIMMDKINGYALFDTLLKKDKYKNIPFIFITAKTEIDDKITGLKKGAIDYIYKPFVVDELIAKIDSLTRHETLRKENYEKDKFASLGMLMGGISHEIFNPLSGISGPLENIKKQIKQSELKDNEQVSKYIQYIEKSIMRIEQIIRNMRALYSEGSSKKEDVDIEEVVKAVFTYYRERGNDQLDFVTRIKEKTIIRTKGDGFFQILSNLVGNAIDSMEGKGEVAVSVDKKESYVLIKVSDTGRGMESEELDQIFNAFYTTKQVRNGTGLGLYLVKDFILKMNWDIKVESIPGKGSIFTIIVKD
jgi:signal transduction histidine kinase/serine/threonine protein kinase